MQALLEEFLQYQEIIKASAENTYKAYANDLQQFSDFVSSEQSELAKIDTLLIIKFLSQFANKNTSNRKLSHVNNFLKFCQDKLDLKDLSKIHSAKIAQKIPHYLSNEELMTSLATMPLKTWQHKRDYALMLLLYASGARISEALAIQHNDFEDNWLKITMAKGSKMRMVPVATAALQAIDEYIKARPFYCDYIFASYQSKPLSRVWAFKIAKKYFNVSPHAFRHSFASALILGGADLRVVQELLGHSSINTTQIYIHIQNEDLKKTLYNYHPLAISKS